MQRVSDLDKAPSGMFELACYLHRTRAIKLSVAVC
jgi:hypothetical protein